MYVFRCCPSGGGAAVHQARQDPEADASGDHRRGADQQERGLGRASLGELVLALALLGRLVADRVGVGVVGALSTVEVDGAGAGVSGGATVRRGTVGPFATTGSATATGRRVTATGSSVATTNSSVATTNSSIATTNSSVTATNSSIATTNSSVTATNSSIATTNSSVTATNSSIATTNSSVTATNSSIATTNSSVTATNSSVTATNSSIATTNSSVTATSHVSATGRVATTGHVTATSHVGAAGRVATTGCSIATTGGVVLAVDADVQTVFVGLGVDADTGDIDTDADGLGRACGGQRGARGNDRARGYPRDADSRLLRHVLLPPVAVLVNGAAIRGARPGGVCSERRPTSCRGHATRPRSHPSQTYARCPSTLSRVKDYVKAVLCNVHRFGNS
nr:hypothetical protein [Streptomyces sp. NBC_00236]